MEKSKDVVEEEGRWSDVDRLFAELLDVPEDERLERLRTACGADWTLYEAVLSLLRATKESEGMFEPPSGDTLRAALERAVGGEAGGPPARVGPYRVVRELGRGGMGTVYLGERDGGDFEQHVAIKLLRRGLDTEDVVGRFLVERRILASLAHPNIARLFDGGATADGRPYFVMEYVEGSPITAYCDARKLSIDARLDLFLAVADAVRYAHANLVIHRDLKPTNILVTADGRVKLLDFGIAKLLHAEGADGLELTRVGARVLTPDYASPEQVRGDTVTTTSDVYQLGLLLLRLLTGHRSRDGRRAASIEEVDTVRPSARIDEAAAVARSSTVDRLRRRLRGDLDTIVQKALRTDPAMRYESVEQLAGDVRRYRAGRPVAARPATRRYRLRKFLARNAWVTPVVLALTAFAGLYLTTSVRHAAQLERERNEATAQAERAEAVQQFLIDLFRSPDMHSPADPARGPRITVVEALAVGEERLRTDLQDRPRIRVALLDALAQVYENLGVADRALPVREEAIALHANLAGAGSLPVRTGLESLGRILNMQGLPDSALVVFERRLDLARQAPEATPAEMAEAYLQLAIHHLDTRQPTLSRAYLDSVLAIAETAEIAVRPLSETYRVLSNLEATVGRLDAAEAAARRTWQMRRTAHGDSAASTLFAQVQLASTLSTMRRIEESRQLFEAALPIMMARLGEDHMLTLNSLNNLAVLYGNAGDHARAESLHRRLLEARRGVFGDSSVQTATSYQNLGANLVWQNRLDEAVPLLDHASAVFDAALPEDSYLRALPWLSLSDVALRRNDGRTAHRHASAAAELLGRALPGTPVMAVAQCRVGRATMLTSGPGAAEAALRHAADVLAGSDGVPAYRRECLESLAELYERTGRPDSALAVRSRMEQARDPG